MYAQGMNPGDVTEARTCRRNSIGDAPAWRLNSVLNEPSDEKPTSRQISRMERFDTVSNCRVC